MMTGNIKILFDGPEDSELTVVLAHGAGVGMNAPFMSVFAEGIASAGHRVARFEFPYMQRQRAEGKRFPPNPAAVLIERYLAVVGALGGGSGLVIGGKSLGCRIATLIANQVGARGVVCLGYPFHPPGKPDNVRIEYLQNITAPTLILQGAEDPFGSPDEVAGYGLPGRRRPPSGDTGRFGDQRRTELGRWCRCDCGVRRRFVVKRANRSCIATVSVLTSSRLDWWWWLRYSRCGWNKFECHWAQCPMREGT